MDNLIVETPEQIPLEFPVAGIGSRFLALAMDTFFQAVAGAALGIVALSLGADGSHMPINRLWATALIVLLLFLLQFGYFAIFEAVWNGQTPGKRLAHLRVIQDSGRPITVYEAVARNLLRVVDSIPVLYGVGIVSALLSAKSKRLGDFVAGTVVIREKPTVLETGLQWDAPPPPAIARYDMARLTPQEFQLIEAFLLRRNQLAANVRADTAGKIAARLATSLQIPPEDQQKPEALLEALAAAYRARARFG